MKSILDPQFKYIPAAKTDIRKTFARIRKEMKRGASPNCEQSFLTTETKREPNGEACSRPQLRIASWQTQKA